MLRGKERDSLFRFIYSSFSENSEPTFGVNFMSKLVIKSTGQRVRLEVWDTAGQERFHALTPQYYQ